MEEVRAGKSRSRRIVFWASSIIVFVIAAGFGVKAVVDRNNRPSELDLWNRASPTSSVIAAPNAWDRIGTTSDVTYGEGSNIVTNFYSGMPVDNIYPILARVPQSGIDEIRQAELGYDDPAWVSEILKKYGLQWNDGRASDSLAGASPQKPVDLNRRLGPNSDLSHLEAFRIMVAFFPGSSDGAFVDAIKQATQSEADTMRGALVGGVPASTVKSIMEKYGIR